MDALTVDQFRDALPDKMKKAINPELIHKINTTLSDPDMYEVYRENLLSYASIMQDGKFKLTNYIDAVKYVSHKLSGKTSLDAFSLTFLTSCIAGLSKGWLLRTKPATSLLTTRANWLRSSWNRA